MSHRRAASRACRARSSGWSAELQNRLRVKPGITGMWQVNGRSSSSFEDYERYDLYYVDNWSLLTDLAIIAKTIPVVLLRRHVLRFLPGDRTDAWLRNRPIRRLS